MITTTCIRYLMFCFTSPRIQDDFAKIGSWSPSNFRAYAEYLNEWPLMEYTLRYIKDHLDLCGTNEEVSQLVTTLIRQLANNQASYYLGRYIEFCCGQTNGQAIPVNEHHETSENIIYHTLNVATEVPKLPHTVEALLLTCTESTPDTERKTPLIIAAQKGLIGAAQLFLDRNIDKNAKDNARRTALHYATENERETIVRLLVEQNVNTGIKDNYEKIALPIAVEKL
jgi:hypothetical protein